MFKMKTIKRKYPFIGAYFVTSKSSKLVFKIIRYEEKYDELTYIYMSNISNNIVLSSGYTLTQFINEQPQYTIIPEDDVRISQKLKNYATIQN